MPAAVVDRILTIAKVELVAIAIPTAIQDMNNGDAFIFDYWYQSKSTRL